MQGFPYEWLLNLSELGMTDAVMRDLAGNSFTGNAYLAAHLDAFVSLPRSLRHVLDFMEPPAPPLSSDEDVDMLLL